MIDIRREFHKKFRTRYSQILGVVFLLMAVLVIRLFVVTVVQHSSWSEAAKNISTKSIYTTAPRGEIFDRNGKLLAGNKQSFSLRLSTNGLTNEQLNADLIKLNNIMKKNGDKFVDNFPIKIKDGKYYYTYDQKIKKWLKKEGFKTNLNAEQAFNALRSKLGIDPSLDRFDAQTEMQNTYNQYPPISVSDMKFSEQQKKEAFLQTYFGSDELLGDASAKEAFKKIRENMKIPEKMTDAQARPIMQARYEVDSLGYSKYLPATIAKKLSNNTVMLIEEDNDLLKGVEVVSETNRYYPHKNSASHILGYMGKITEEEKEKYAQKGYETSALVGKEGIEGKYEKILAGKNGEKVVQVNNQGQTSKVINQTKAEKGKDIYLTIDLDLQQTAEKYLEKTIYAMKYGGGVSGETGYTSSSEMAPKAKSGAVVAIDVATGDVLAMASYPDYDPNLFADGISDKNWEKLQSKNPRDSLSPAPLYNLATMATVQPGSTFKPITAMTALECGLDPVEYHTDGGFIKLGGTTFACVVWNKSRKNHGPIDMFRAIGVSCNYYFYDIATGKDWYTGSPLNYKKKINIDMITNYAQQFGLGRPTGIELDEAYVPVPSKQRKIDALKNNLKNELFAASEEYFKPSVVKDQDELNENIEKMAGWLGDKSMKNLKWETLYEDLLPSVGIKDSKRRKVGEMFLYDYYPQAKWTTGDVFNICIGQGENSYTPLQIANYIATLGNYGKHNQVSVIKAIQDEGNTKKAHPTKVDIKKKKYYDYVIRGMRQVAESKESTVSAAFKNFKVNKRKINIAAKTGTAEKAGKVNPKSEVSYIKRHLSQIAPKLRWKKVKAEMERLMDKYPDLYTTKDMAVRRAVINLTNGKVTTKDLDRFKSDYDEFAWVVAMAPAEKPEIAICAMVPQGVTAANAAPVVKEILGKYFDTKSKTKTLNMNTDML